MSRIFAFTCLTCAAFAWVPPGIDRAGLAALGVGFMAWSIGRGMRLPFAITPKPNGPAALTRPDLIEPLSSDYVMEAARRMQEDAAGIDGRG